MIIGAGLDQNSLDTAQRLSELKKELGSLEHTIVTHLQPKYTAPVEFLDEIQLQSQPSDQLTQAEIYRNMNRRYRLMIRNIININANAQA